MHLFKNRPLAFFCLIFILVSNLVYRISAEKKLIAVSALFVCLSVFVILSIFWRRRHIACVFLSVCLAFALCAVLIGFVFVDCKRADALEHEGRRGVLATVIDEKYSSEHSSEYTARIEEIDGESVSLRTVLIFAGQTNYSAGDKIYAYAVIYPAEDRVMGYERYTDENIYIQAAVYENSDHVLVSSGNMSFEVIFERLRNLTSEYMKSVFGESTGALAKGFLLGDTEDIPIDVLRDFRRSGTSHLLSVSGLHMSVIMGAAEFLLRRLRIKKGVRCVLLTAISLFFLAMTGFAMSACRSVIMLIFVYMAYLFVRENDPITSLFASVAIIMAIFPHSALDIGLWLSFLATLGILAVYMPLAKLLRAHPPKNFFFKLCRGFLMAIMLTFICNVFICVVVWAVFGEISVISLISNILLSPISEIFIVAVPLAALLGKLPLIGGVLVKILSLLGELITGLCSVFSSWDGAVISLRYSFAGAIILLMSLALVVMLVVKLRHKWMIMIPPLTACLAFCICLVSYNSIHKGEVKATALSEGKNEMIILTEDRSAVICDFSSGSYSFLNKASTVIDENMATEVDTYILTHYHNRQCATLEKLFRSMMIRRVCLPTPETRAEYEIMEDILELSERYNVKVKMYSYSDSLLIFDRTYVSVLRSNNSMNDTHAAFSAFFETDGDLLSYLNIGGENDRRVAEAAGLSDYIFIGSHGTQEEKGFSFGDKYDKVKLFYYTDRDAARFSEIDHKNIPAYIPKNDEGGSFEIVLGDNS